MSLAQLLLRFRRQLGFATVLAVIGGVGSTLLLITTSTLIGAPHRSLTLFIVLAVLVPVFRSASEYNLSHLCQNILDNLRCELAEKVLRMPQAQLEHVGTQRISTHLSEDLPNISAAIGSLPFLVLNALVVVGAALYIAYLNVYFFVGTLLLLLFSFTAYHLLVKSASKDLTAANYHHTGILHSFHSLVSGSPELKAYADIKQRFLVDVLRPVTHSYAVSMVQSSLRYSVGSGFQHLALSGMIILVILLSRSSMSGATTSGLLLSVFYLVNPLQTLVASVPPLARARHAVEAMGTMSSTSTELPTTASYDLTSWNTLNVEQVTYRHSATLSCFTFGPVSLSIRRKEVIFIVGANGSGKTTLVRLLTGLYSPSGGMITVDEVVIQDENRAALRSLFAYVPGDIHFLHEFDYRASFRVPENLDLLIQMFHLSDVLQPGTSTWSQYRLSKGQQKRLALLNTLLLGNDILILDEWTADQDPDARRRFYFEVLPELRRLGKTVILITHDAEFFSHADRLIHLADGKVTSV